MIFSTFNQLNCFLIFFVLGLFLGILYSIINILFLSKKLKKYQKNILNCVFFSLFSFIFIVFLHIFNFGVFKLSLFLVSILAFLWIKILLANLVVFLENKWYNVLIKLFKRKHKTCNTKKSNL